MKKTTTTIKYFALPFALAVAFLNAACEPASLKKTDAPAPEANVAAAASAQTDAEKLDADLQTMRTANFDFVYVFRRKDGGAFDGEDKKFLRANAPVATNRFVLSEGDRAVIAGSSYKFEQSNLDKLKERFVIENFSKPEGANADAADAFAPQNSNR